MSTLLALRSLVPTKTSFRNAIATLVLLNLTFPAAKAIGRDDAQKPVAFNLCSVGVEDYLRTRERFLEQYPIGSDVENLVSAIHNGENFNAKLFDKPLAKPKGKMSADIWAYFFEIKCEAQGTSQTLWQILIYRDDQRRITGRELRLNLHDEDFSARRIPFQFEYFLFQEDGKVALWSLTGPATTRDAVDTIMRQAGAKKSLSRPTKNNGVIDQYRWAEQDTFLTMIFPNIWVVLWSFDEDGHLTELRIN